jgi:hypothetical protein
MPTTLKTTNIGPFVPGMSNRRPDFALFDKDKGTFARTIVNGDVDAGGIVKRRKGSAREITGVDCHSLWLDDTATFGYYVDGATLFRVDDGGGTLRKTTVRTDLLQGLRMSYAQVNDSVYYSNNAVIGRLDIHGDNAAGVPTFAAQPVFTAGGAGSGALQAGLYEAVLVFVNLAGEESGSTYPVQIAVPANGSLVISSLPTSYPAGANLIRLYISPPNGDTMFASGFLPVASSFTLSVLPVSGGRCQTLFRTQMPVGQIVRFLNGRLMVASGSTLNYSDPFAPALYNPAKNYITFPAPITMMEPCQNGVYVAADQTYWIAGDLTKAELNPVLPYGAAQYSSVQIPNENAVAWMSARGLVKGSQDGKVTNLQEADVAIEPGLGAATFIRERDGTKHAISSLFGIGPTQMAADSFATAEVIRKGTSL